MLGDDRLLHGRPYWIKIGSRTVGAQITEIKHKVDVNTQDELAAKHLELNEVARVNLYLDQPVAFEKYEDNHDLGAFILIDRQTNSTRSEEHTSELQSLMRISYAVFCLKKTNIPHTYFFPTHKTNIPYIRIHNYYNRITKVQSQ